MTDQSSQIVLLPTPRRIERSDATCRVPAKGAGGVPVRTAELREITEACLGESVRPVQAGEPALEFRVPGGAANSLGDGWRSMLPVDELFDAVIDSAHVGMRKPDPRIFALALHQLGGIAPDKAVFLDDFHGNVAAAERIGLRGILVEDDFRPALEALRALLA